MNEREKYELIWAYPEYRKNSPAEAIFPGIMKQLANADGSLIDFGCGTGRATYRLQKEGFDVIGVDIAWNAPDEDMQGRFPFLVSDILLIPPGMLRANYGLCVDVLEHIPVDELQAVIGRLSTLCETLLVQVANFEEGHGKDLIGEPLHHVFQARDDWQRMLSASFGFVKEVDLEDESGLPRYAFVCRSESCHL